MGMFMKIRFVIGVFIGIHIPKSITQDTTMLIQMFLKFKGMF